MKKQLRSNLIYLSVGALVGVFIFLVVLFAMAPSLMMTESQSKYDFNETVELFQQSVTDAGWGILNVHDMQAVKANLGYEVLPVKIFDVCSGQYSARILEVDDARIVTPMMPCRISIYEKSDGNTYVGRMNSGLVARLFGGVINDVMQLATAETEELLESIIA